MNHDRNEITKLIIALENVLESWEMEFTVEEDQSVYRAARLALHTAKEHLKENAT
jgi:ElaB/YqjD/DUF883 family membrane-anchored ribosome-binding protein